MKPTDELMKEHSVILSMLEILDVACKRLETGQPVSNEDLLQMLDFFKLFADQCHHGKEEKILFPEMVRAGIPGERGPIGVMLAEHTTGRKYMREMVESLHRFIGGDPGSRGGFILSSRRYISLLEQHISKENAVLFPMADMIISSGVMEQVSRDFVKLESEKFSPDVHEKFHALIARLRSTYQL